ncbi:MAG: hypothetical protein IT539_05985 [Bradyrhizobiaceae bacterium]|nr:hypothetical protein [Bradyrhizobiaceae bacterium]
MIDKPGSGPRQSPQRPAADARAERLAAALRANLKRRKERARSRTAEAATRGEGGSAQKRPVE